MPARKKRLFKVGWSQGIWQQSLGHLAPEVPACGGQKPACAHFRGRFFLKSLSAAKPFHVWTALVRQLNHGP